MIGFDNKMEYLCANNRRTQKIKDDRKARKLAAANAKAASPKKSAREEPPEADELQPTAFRTGDWISLQDGEGIAMAHGTLLFQCCNVSCVRQASFLIW